MLSKEVLNELDVLKTELENISSSIKYINKASEVAQNSSEVINKVTELSSRIESMQKEHLVNLNNYHKRKIESIQESLKEVIANSDSKIVEIQSLIKATKSINTSIKDYFEKIYGIDFPSRLDKIDNQISSINIGTGNLQTTLQQLSNNSDQKFEKLTVENDEFKIKIGFLNRNVKVNRIITIIGLVMIVCLLTYIAFK